jgi:hypothetical protein
MSKSRSGNREDALQHLVLCPAENGASATFRPTSAPLGTASWSDKPAACKTRAATRAGHAAMHATTRVVEPRACVLFRRHAGWGTLHTPPQPQNFLVERDAGPQVQSPRATWAHPAIDSSRLPTGSIGLDHEAASLKLVVVHAALPVSVRHRPRSRGRLIEAAIDSGFSGAYAPSASITRPPH